MLGAQLRHPRRRHGSEVPASRERDRAVVRRDRRQASRACGCTTASSTSTTRRCRSRSATSSASATCSDSRPRARSGGAAVTSCSRATIADRSTIRSAQIEQADAALTRLYTALRDVEPAETYEPERGDAAVRSRDGRRLQHAGGDRRAAEPGDGDQPREGCERRGKASALAAELRKLGGVLGRAQLQPEDFCGKPRGALAGTQSMRSGSRNRRRRPRTRDIERLIAERRAARAAPELQGVGPDPRRARRRRESILEDKPDGTTAWRRA